MTKYVNGEDTVQATQWTGTNLQYILGLLSLDFDPPISELEKMAFENLQYRYTVEGYSLKTPTRTIVVSVGQWIVISEDGDHMVYTNSEFTKRYKRYYKGD